MQVSLLSKHELPLVPSASGVEVTGGFIYIVGDDSAYLYKLDAAAQVLETIPLFATDVKEGRIPKKSKPDFESLTYFNMEGKNLLFTLGSGSLSPERDSGYLLDLTTYQSTLVSLTGLYSQLRQLPEVIGEGKLNIEGAAANDEYLVLVQRGYVTGKNVLIQYKLQEFYAYLMQTSASLPSPLVYSYTLPKLSGLQSGFSGIAFVPGRNEVLITASVEDTTNEIDDGAIMGSYIGKIDLSHKADNFLGTLVEYKGSTYLGKIESIAIQQVNPDNSIQAVAVTDSDLGGSELLFLQIQL